MEKADFTVTRQAPVSSVEYKSPHPRWCGRVGCQLCEGAHKDANPHCPKCDGLLFLYRCKPDGRPDYGQLIICDEPGCYQKEVQQYNSVTGISQLNTFESFVRIPEAENAYEAAVSFAGGKADFIFLTIFGGIGCGKSHLCNATALKLQQAGEIAKVADMSGMLDYIMSGFGNSTSYAKTKEYQMMPFLAIDDMKVEYLKDTRTSTRLEIFEQIIKYRVDALMPTMITTNNTPDEIPDRMQSRLSDARYARLVANKAPDYRRKKG